jgi:hypothetical protein
VRQFNGSSSKYLAGSAFSTIDLGRNQFLVETVVNDSSARTVFYQIVDAALRNGNISTLELCPKCSTVFTNRTCPSCSRKARNAYMARHMKNLRKEAKQAARELKAKQTQGSQDKAFEQLLRDAASKNVSVQQQVGPVAKALGNGRSNKGWLILDQLVKQWRDGMPPRQVRAGMSPQSKQILKRHLV